MVNIPERDAKRALLEERLRKLTAEKRSGTTIKRRELGVVPPLSYGQRQLFFIQQIDAANPAYNSPVTLRLVGPLQLQVLEQSFNEILSRHEVLRTRFDFVGEEPYQLVSPQETIQLQVVDLSDQQPDVREQLAQEWMSHDAKTSFHLALDLPIRATLLRLQEEEHLLLINLHHIVSDGFFRHLFQELSTCYRQGLQGEPSLLPELPVQYGDYALWQREQVINGAWNDQLQYWQQKLQNLPTMNVPTDFPRPPVQSTRGAIEDMQIPAELVAGLQLIAQQEQTSLFMVFVTLFQVLLQRYTGQDDLVIGLPTEGRTRRELEPVIGYFVNSVVLRTHVYEQMTFRELLQEVRKNCLEAFSNQDIPFDQVTDKLRVKRDSSRTSLFQIMMNYSDSEQVGLYLPGLEVEILEPTTDASKFDLNFLLTKRDDVVTAEMIYCTDLFHAETIRRLLGHYLETIQSVVADPEQRVSDIDLLSAEEKHQVLTVFPHASRQYDVRCLHERFEEMVERHPLATAVVCEEQRLTYAELNARANQLARHLRKQGVGADMLVGLSMERSAEMIVGLLAILKAGAAYVPLDPSYPVDRLEYMIGDAGIKMLVTQERLLESLPIGDVQVFCIDRVWTMVAAEATDNLGATCTPENLCYIIYTSGSTGRPKGVMIEHRNVSRLLDATADWYRFCADDVWTMFHSYAFDFSVWEIWGPLAYGGTLVVVPYVVSRSPELFYELLVREQVTVLNQTPSAFLQLVQAEELVGQSPDLRLRYVIFGGEALEFAKLKSWTDRHGFDQPQLINMYGITETTVHVTYRPIEAHDLNQASGSNIGHAIPDLQVYVLDESLRPLPIGVPGEMYIGGAGVARGYLHRAELTAERFLPNPFDPQKSETLYRSGDLARYLPDGSLEYWGRIDQQVKIRGFRIELGEIESALSLHPRLSAAVVIAHEDETHNKRLVAYVVPKEQVPPSSQELREFLLASLPKYMVPSIFMTLPALPLTANGKVNKRALPEPVVERAIVPEEQVLPRNEVEQQLVEIWCQVLRLPSVGIHDNFFELGGDSILGMQMIAKANKLDMGLSTRYLFEYQTIAELAAKTGKGRQIDAEQGTVSGPVALTPIQTWFFERNIPHRHHWNQAELLELQPNIDPIVMEFAMQYVVEHHDALRMRFQNVGPVWTQEGSKAETTPYFTSFDLSALSETAQREALEAYAADLLASLDLANGPLLRAAFFERGAGKRNWLLLVIHHLVVDGVSWRILLEDLQSAYWQLNRGEPAMLPPKTTSFQSWANRLQAAAQTDVFTKEVSTWESLLQGESKQLPCDLAAGENTEASARKVTVELTAEETRRLLQEVPKMYRSEINDVLLAALLKAYYEWSGDDSLVLAMEGHGREPFTDDVDLSRTVGWFTSIFPVRLQRKQETLEQLVVAVKETLRRIPNRGMGYGVLQHLGTEEAKARLAALAKPELIFNYLGQFESDYRLFEPATFVPGPDHDPQAERPYLLSIDSSVTNGVLRVNWSYSAHRHQRSTIEKLARAYKEALLAFLQQKAPEQVVISPTDFPLADLNTDILSRLSQLVGHAGNKE